MDKSLLEPKLFTFFKGCIQRNSVFWIQFSFHLPQNITNHHIQRIYLICLYLDRFSYFPLNCISYLLFLLILKTITYYSLPCQLSILDYYLVKGIGSVANLGFPKKFLWNTNFFGGKNIFPTDLIRKLSFRNYLFL